MSDIMDILFGPLGRQYCIYFYIMSIFSFLGYILALIYIFFKIVKEPKKLLSFEFMFKSVSIIFYTLLPYFVERLLYTMCINSVN
jgi:ABC-type Na+ efflux pump permease subunit